MQYPADSANTCRRLKLLLRNVVVMLSICVRSAESTGSRKQTVLKTFFTWHCANAVEPASSWPRDFAPWPLPGRAWFQPINAFCPTRQWLFHESSGVTKPSGKVLLLLKYFGCITPGVYTSRVLVSS